MDAIDAQVETAAQATAPDAVLPRCALSMPQPEGSPLTPFRDEEELTRYLEPSSWLTNARVDGWPVPSVDPDGPAAADVTAASAGAADPQIFFLREGYGEAVDLGVPGAPRQVSRVGIRGSVTDRIAAGAILREGAFFYTFEPLSFGRRADDDAPWSGRVPTYGAPAPLPRNGGVRISGYVVRGGALVALDSTYIQASLPSYGEVTSIDGELVFPLDFVPSAELVPDAAQGCSRSRLVLPRVLRRAAGSDRLQLQGPLLAATDVMWPAPQLSNLTPLRDPRLSALVRCKPGVDGALRCSARAHLGGGAGHLLSTRERIYTSDDWRVYAWQLADGTLSVHRYQSAPRYDRRKTQAIELDGALHIAVTMTSPVRMAIESLPLAAFDRQGMQRTSPRVLAEVGGSKRPVLREAFVGGTYVASFGSFGTDASTLVMYDVRSRSEPLVLTGDSPVLSISPIGSDRVLLGAPGGLLAARQGTTLQVWTLGAHPTLRSALALPAHEVNDMPASYRARADGSAVLGLPMHALPPPTGSAGDAHVGIFTLSAEHQLALLGTVAPEDVAPPEARTHGCVGPAQALFLAERSFAMMCDSVQELTIDDGVRTLGRSLQLSYLLR